MFDVGSIVVESWRVPFCHGMYALYGMTIFLGEKKQNFEFSEQGVRWSDPV